MNLWRFAVLSLLSLPAFAQATNGCAALKEIALPDARVTAVTSVPGGPFTPPRETRAANLPAFCRVEGVIDAEIQFEVWMPANGWNRKFLIVGNGGLAGSISYRAMVSPLQIGYAVASTDTGHLASNEAWALGHYQRMVDFGFRAMHRLAQTGKGLVRAHYGSEAAHSYFVGCSNGGRQALVAAQKFPADFDGIVAGDPAANWSRLYTGGHLWVMRAMDGDGYLPASKVPVLANAVRAACDALDGISDGLLNDPRRCKFDPGVLQCAAGDQPDCLTGAQIASVRKLWQGVTDNQGRLIYPGLMPGSEDGPGGWAQWITGSAPGNGAHAGLGFPAFRYMVFENPDWDFRSFRYDVPLGFDSDVDYTDQKMASLMNATDPDLRPFQARGGKLIQYHGWSDPDISAVNSINYYEQVTQVTGDPRGFYRLFLVPGMQHCDGSGPGPNQFDMLGALNRWVERGEAPQKITATHLTPEGRPDRTRPVCPYPQEARWNGQGSTDEAGNFSCVAP